jgi:type II secretory pathway pseudopilin PulG
MRKLILILGIASLLTLGCQQGPTETEKAQQAAAKAQEAAAKAQEEAAKATARAAAQSEATEKATLEAANKAAAEFSNAVKGISDEVKAATDAAKNP